MKEDYRKHISNDSFFSSIVNHHIFIDNFNSMCQNQVQKQLDTKIEELKNELNVENVIKEEIELKSSEIIKLQKSALERIPK